MEEVEPVEIEYVIHKKVQLEQINRLVHEGYHTRTTERCVLEPLEGNDLKFSVSVDKYKSMEAAISFITEHRKDLQYTELVILPQVKIPHIYE